ncbi:DnaJ domain-containing protein [Desulfatirhabdium butyrativorans]|uniref:DnaJ domain-containing protein n=1 Tax=Desulfatirhabdium butyrativorans TaxID=340467 RepID=UPI000409BF16|nr:DnaJ domain-containing protein [Desulfatirhabdium butyrativorans]
MEPVDYYTTLGVSPQASQQDIKRAYRDLAFQYHPDHCKDADCSDRMKAINEAYAVLSDTKKRNEYDTLKCQYGNAATNQFRNAYSEQEIFRGSDIQQVFEEMARAFGIRGFDEIFKQCYGPNYRQFEFKRPGVFVKGFMFSGFFPGIPLGGPAMLASGLGKGIRQLLGKSASKSGGPADIAERIVLPEELAKTGGPYAYYHRNQGKKLIVHIPAGIREGQKIRLAKMGTTDPKTGQTGDLYLTVSIRRSFAQKLKGMFRIGYKGS